MRRMAPALVALTLCTLGFAETNCCQSTQTCPAPTPPAPCWPDTTPDCPYCLGPDCVNPDVRPIHCGGDFTFYGAAIWWNANEDGLAFAVDTTQSISHPPFSVIHARYARPQAHWELGFKVGIGYNTTFNGWDADLTWTHYQGRASEEVEADPSDNHTLLTLWSAYADTCNHITTVASFAGAQWKLQLDLLDFELGREFWTGRYLTLRPFIGLRYGRIRQHYNIQYSGGSYAGSITHRVCEFNPRYPFGDDYISMSNVFKGTGVRSGLDTVWNIGRGVSFYGNLALSLLYGRFHMNQNEDVVAPVSPFSTTNILSSEDGFRASRAMTDLAVGIQYSTLFNDCQYGFTLALGWEHHLFFNQNQLWRVEMPATVDTDGDVAVGVDIIQESRGDLSTQGWTLSASFEF